MRSTTSPSGADPSEPPAVAFSTPLSAADAEVPPSEAARLLGVTRQYVDRLIARGELPAHRLPGSRYRRVPLRAVLARLDSADASAMSSPPPEPAATAPERARPATGKGRQRRDRLVAATARLVAEHGFHAVRLSDIGAAAGVTGPAVYRHFSGKLELLVAVFDQVVAELLEGSSRLLGGTSEPAAQLEALVRHHVSLVVRDPAVFGVYVQEVQNLPAEARTRLRRGQREYVLRFASVLRRELPGIDADEARTRVQAAFGLLNAVAHLPRALPQPRLEDLLACMALAAMRCETRPDAAGVTASGTAP